MNIIEQLEKEQMKDNLPKFSTGDTIAIHYKVTESGKERIQIFEGIVLRRQGAGVRENVTVRKVSNAIGVERTIPVHSPKIAKIEVKREGDVNRSKLYYLRGTVGRKSRVKERRRGQ